MKSLDEIRKEKEKMEALVQQIADYMEFMEPSEELNEEDLDLVAAARGRTSYEEFLRKMKK